MLTYLNACIYVYNAGPQCELVYVLICVILLKLDRGCPNRTNTPRGTIFQDIKISIVTLTLPHGESACEVS